MASRKKNITGSGKDVSKRGDGLGTGPVGKTEKSGDKAKSALKFVAKELVKKAMK